MEIVYTDHEGQNFSPKSFEVRVGQYGAEAIELDPRITSVMDAARTQFRDWRSRAMTKTTTKGRTIDPTDPTAMRYERTLNDIRSLQDSLMQSSSGKLEVAVTPEDVSGVFKILETIGNAAANFYSTNIMRSSNPVMAERARQQFGELFPIATELGLLATTEPYGEDHALFVDPTTHAVSTRHTGTPG